MCSALVRGPAISWLCTRERKAEAKSGEYGGWMIANTCRRGEQVTGCYLRQTAVTTPHLRDKVSDEGVVKYLGGHAALDIANHREDTATAKQLHQPIHQTPLQLQL